MSRLDSHQLIFGSCNCTSLYIKCRHISGTSHQDLEQQIACNILTSSVRPGRRTSCGPSTYLLFFSSSESVSARLHQAQPLPRLQTAYELGRLAPWAHSIHQQSLFSLLGAMSRPSYREIRRHHMADCCRLLSYLSHEGIIYLAKRM